MRKRINISLPELAIRVLDRAVKRGERSRFIDQAIRTYLKQKSRAQLRKALADGYRQSAEEDLALAGDWFDLDEEAWLGKLRARTLAQVDRALKVSLGLIDL